MEILVRGTKPSDIPYIVTCYTCKTKFKFMECEGEISYDQRDGNFVKVFCPVCRTMCTSRQHVYANV